MASRATVLMVALLAAGCGGTSSQPDPSASETVQPTAATNGTPAPPDAVADIGATSTPVAADRLDLPPPFDCDTTIDGNTLSIDGPAPVELIERRLPLMREMHADTVGVWERFGIQPDHLVVDGLPRLLVGADDARGRCQEIVDSVAHPGLVMIVDWTEEGYSALHENGSPPWRRLIEAQIGDFRDRARRWTSMGTGQHGVTVVRLNPGEDELAGDLADKFGPLVDLEIGNFEFDADTGSIVGVDLCSEVPTENVRAGVADFGRRRTGNFDHRMSVDLVNGNDEPIHVIPARVAELTLPDSTRTVTAFASGIYDEVRESRPVVKGGLTVAVADLSFAPCDPALGSELSPGIYEAALVIEVYDEPTWEGERTPDEFLVARMQIEIP